jgi:TonB family protein
MTETEIWTKWESQVVNGLFPLRRFLGRSNHSVVFLTECRGQNLANAAIKIIPEDPSQAETQLSRWRAAAALPHPNLIRLIDVGRCKLGGHPFLFVVTEYAEQNLAQLLPHRGLTQDEAKEMLSPALEALKFLHSRQVVHGQLQPPNFLVVDDRLKLSVDGIRPRGEPRTGAAKPSPYDPPEARNGALEFAGDVWSLGATLMEALTQIPPGPHDGADPRLPSSLPAEFSDTVRRCLSIDPTRRPTLSSLEAQLLPSPEASTPEPAATAIAATDSAMAPPPAEPARPAIRELPRQPLPRPGPMTPQWLIPAIVGFVVFMAFWLTFRAMHGRAAAHPPEPAALVSPQPTSAIPPTPPVAASASGALHEEMPSISRTARNSIRGQIKVVVRVTVDRTGNVTGQNIEVRGSSRYFARAATEAAKKWKFAPADNPATREWLIHFDFAHDGIGAHAIPRG